MTGETALGRDIGTRLGVILVAGVSGSGKSTVGEALAKALGWPYEEADTFHPAANIAKMSKGIALTDEDRAPWLAAIAASIADVCARGDHAVITCSALKRAYRSVLMGGQGERVRVVLLDGSEEEIAARLAARKGHFMPPSLLHSQFAALERPTADENAITVPIGGSVDDVVSRTIAALRT